MSAGSLALKDSNSLANPCFGMVDLKNPALDQEIQTRYTKRVGVDEAGDVVVQETQQNTLNDEAVFVNKRVKRTCTNSSGYQTTTSVDWAATERPQDGLERAQEREPPKMLIWHGAANPITKDPDQILR